MYGEYKRNWCTDNACWNPAVHENYPEHQRAMKRRTSGEVTYVNQYGDRFSKNDQGQVTTFRYRHNDVTYAMTYDRNGEVKAIEGSNGWTWARKVDAEFSGWHVRNIFDGWDVADEECGALVVDESGIRSLGGSCATIGLPERP